MNEAVRANAPIRNTNARWVFVFGMSLLFSYQTVVAASYKTTHIRQHNHWGPTTGRHLKEYGVSDYKVIADQQEFHDEVRKLLFKAASDDLTKEMR